MMDCSFVVVLIYHHHHRLGEHAIVHSRRSRPLVSVLADHLHRIELIQCCHQNGYLSCEGRKLQSGMKADHLPPDQACVIRIYVYLVPRNRARSFLGVTLAPLWRSLYDYEPAVYSTPHFPRKEQPCHSCQCALLGVSSVLNQSRAGSVWFSIQL